MALGVGGKGGAPGGGAPQGNFPPTERFTITFNPDKRHEYTAENFARDAKSYIQDIASGPNYCWFSLWIPSVPLVCT